VPDDIVAAVDKAQELTFVDYERLRKPVFQALAAGQPTPMLYDELLKSSNPALDSLTAVAETAMQAAQRQADEKGAEAGRGLVLHAALLAIALLVGTLGLFVVHRRVTAPIAAMTAVMRRLAEGDMSTVIPGTARRDEIGAMAKAVEVFKAGMGEAEELRLQQDRAKIGAEEERRAAMLAIAEAFEQSVGGIVGTVASAAGQMRSAAKGMSGTVSEADRLAMAVSAAAEQASANFQGSPPPPRNCPPRSTRSASRSTSRPASPRRPPARRSAPTSPSRASAKPPRRSVR